MLQGHYTFDTWEVLEKMQSNKKRENGGTKGASSSAANTIQVKNMHFLSKTKRAESLGTNITMSIGQPTKKFSRLLSSSVYEEPNDATMRAKGASA